MIQMFAKEYKESITLAYYCVNLLLTIVVFTVGTIYLWHRDRRDQQRRIREDREYQERRDQEDRRDQHRRLQEDREYQKRRDQEDRRDHQRREWRQFAERIYTDYSRLKSKDIPHNISKVKNTFERIIIHSEVTGLDVLRYMLADDNYRNFSNESPQLRALREDLHMIFLPLNICSSLLLLGEVPENIKEEIRLVVEELGTVAKPFLTGEQRRFALKCLEHFSSERSSNAEAENAERRVNELDWRLKDIVPYVNSLHFGGKKLQTNSGAMEECDYSECRGFSLNLKGKMIMDNSYENLRFLIKLHRDLEREELEGHFARILRGQLAELPVGSIEQISDSDSDEAVLTKVLHEVRLYIHLQRVSLSENPSMAAAEHNGRIETNINRLRKVHEEVTAFQPLKDEIKYFCERFIADLKLIERDPTNHLNNHEFKEELEQLYETFCNMIRGRLNVERFFNTISDGNPRAGGGGGDLLLPLEFQLINIRSELAETAL